MIRLVELLEGLGLKMTKGEKKSRYRQWHDLCDVFQPISSKCSDKIKMKLKFIDTVKLHFYFHTSNKKYLVHFKIVMFSLFAL